MIKKYTEAVIIGFPITEASLMLFYDNIFVKSIDLKHSIKNKKKIWCINSLLIGKVFIFVFKERNSESKYRN